MKKQDSPNKTEATKKEKMLDPVEKMLEQAIAQHAVDKLVLEETKQNYENALDQYTRTALLIDLIKQKI